MSFSSGDLPPIAIFFLLEVRVQGKAHRQAQLHIEPHLVAHAFSIAWLRCSAHLLIVFPRSKQCLFGFGLTSDCRKQWPCHLMSSRLCSISGVRFRIQKHPGHFWLSKVWCPPTGNHRYNDISKEIPWQRQPCEIWASALLQVASSLWTPPEFFPPLQLTFSWKQQGQPFWPQDICSGKTEEALHLNGFALQIGKLSSK